MAEQLALLNEEKERLNKEVAARALDAEVKEWFKKYQEAIDTNGQIIESAKASLIEQSQKIANTSTIRATLYLHQGGMNFYLYQLAGVVSIGGQERSWSLYIDHARPWNTHFQVAQFTFTVAHDYDGSKVAGCRATLGVQGSSASWAPFNHDTGVRYMSLTTIPRQSSLAFDSGVIGRPMSFRIDRKASYTHTLRYQFGRLQGTIATGVTTLATWTPPENLASQIANDVTGIGTVFLDTYNGSSLIGTTSHYLTLTVPDSMVPVVRGVSLSDGNATVAEILPANQFLKTISMIKASLTGVSGVQGSTIKSYHFQMVTIDGRATGLQSSTNGGSLGNVTFHGDYKIRGWVIDSRGRESPVQEVSLKIYDYTLPAINIRADRTSSSETMANITRTARVSSLVVGGLEKNRLSLSFRVRELPDGQWSDVGGDAVVREGLLLSLVNSTTGIAGTYAPDKAYEFEARVSDKFQFNVTTARLSGVSVVHSYSVNNFGFGKIPSQANVVDSEWPYLFQGNQVAVVTAGIVAYIVPIASLYFTNKARIKESEHRQTVLEMEVKHLKEQVDANVCRLDKHEEQSRAMVSMIEQVRHLTVIIEEVKKDVKSLMIKGE